MERCIVAPVDGSSFGEHALPFAATLAKRTGSALHIVHVHVPLIAPSGAEAVAFDGSWNELARKQERSYLDAVVARVAAAHDVEVDSILVEGPVATALEECIRECGAGLVVMSTHAHIRFRRLWHNGVADHIARELPIPVLLVHPLREDEEPDLAAEPRLRHILIPLDGSVYAEAMVDHAVSLGRPLGTRFTLLRVVRPEIEIGYTLLGQNGHLNHHRLGTEQTAARQYLNAVAERMRGRGLEVETRVVVSEDPAAAITEFARASADDEAPVDLIAIETHPHRSVARILGAHTADLILRDSPVPVLLFDAPAAAEARREDSRADLPLPSA